MTADTTAYLDQSGIAGLVLAAGGGTRYGSPKALVRGADGVPWLQQAVSTLAESGCSPLIVVLGAAAEQAETVLAVSAGLDTPVIIVRAPDWAEGLSVSLRAGVDAAAQLVPTPRAIAVVPVDVPDLNAATVTRMLGHDLHEQVPITTDSLRQAVFGGRPGHPVLIGRAHWAKLTAGLASDRGARPYLRAHRVQEVECGDLSTGLDVDSPD